MAKKENEYPRRRKLESDSASPSVEVEYLDTSEQEAHVKELEDSCERYSRRWRRCFAAVGTAGTLFLLLSAFRQASAPWGTRYHAALRGVMPSALIFLAEVASAAVSGVAASALMSTIHGRRDALLGAGLLGGAGLAALWLYFASALPRQDRWQILWLPLAPLLCILMLLPPLGDQE
eukprot:jgi/Mesen1/4650/ME000241S03684